MKEPSLDFREIKAESIARRFGWVRRVSESQYKVHSQRLDNEYDVLSTETGWYCSCPDHIYRGMKCKHVRAVELSFILRKIVARAPLVIQPVRANRCPSCDSARIVKHGQRHNRYGDIQRFSCKGCGKRFVVNIGFEKMQATPQAITSAMQLYFSGESFRSVQKFLRLQGVNVSHVSVYSWVKKYVRLMEGYVDKLNPQVGDVWRADELYLKVRGNMKYLFALMDDETRFWIGQQVADTKYTADVRPLFAESKQVAGKMPRALITDGGQHFAPAFTKEFWTTRNPRPIHVRDIRLDGTVHNNKMERMNGEVRDREKVMRGLKRADTPILKGYQIYHNFLRPHEGLQGDTPASRAGVKVEGSNKWITLIQNASRKDAYVQP